MTGFPCHHFRFNPYHTIATGILKGNGKHKSGVCLKDRHGRGNMIKFFA